MCFPGASNYQFLWVLTMVGCITGSNIALMVVILHIYIYTIIYNKRIFFVNILCKWLCNCVVNIKIGHPKQSINQLINQPLLGTLPWLAMYMYILKTHLKESWDSIFNLLRHEPNIFKEPEYMSVSGQIPHLTQYTVVLKEQQTRTTLKITRVTL